MATSRLIWGTTAAGFVNDKDLKGTLAAERPRENLRTVTHHFIIFFPACASILTWIQRT